MILKRTSPYDSSEAYAVLQDSSFREIGYIKIDNKFDEANFGNLEYTNVLIVSNNVQFNPTYTSCDLYYTIWVGFNFKWFFV